MKKDFIFTSESVTEGHPDKLCDGISDAIVDRFLQQDPFSRVIVECAVATGILFVAARFASKAIVDLPSVARGLIAGAGYEDEGFNPKTCSIMTSLVEFDDGHDERDEKEMTDAEIERIAVTDQVTVFGFACRQTPALMPLPIWLAHKLARRLAEVRARGTLSYLAPDGKTQAAVEYRRGRPERIHGLTLVAALRGGRDLPDAGRLREDLMERVVEPVFNDEPLRPDRRSRIFINPGGPWVGGGPAMHSGLTGRKTGIDTYGEYARESHSALSGKDPARIDRIGTYAARYAAKNVVAAGLADECEVQLSYAIGLSRPVSVQVETFGTGRLADAEITARVERTVDFRLAGIVRRFDLRHRPAADPLGFYRRLAAYGHVGRTDLDLPWEATDRADDLRG
jgi:S-adenosylmethionine synthetase